MANYAIMRCEKVKSFGQLRRSLEHNFRDKETPNADPERTHLNEHDGAERSTEAMGKVRERLPTKRRKDAVIGIEYMMTASPEWMAKATDDQKREFFDRSKQWLIDKYGKDNVVLSSIHRDETTEHMSAWVTPITPDGRLCAKDFIGGPSKLRADQTSYAEQVKDIGLKRGIRGSKAKHERIQAFYSAIQPQELRKDIQREHAPKIGENDIVRKPITRKIDVDETIHGINNKISDRWHEQEQYKVLRSTELERAQNVAKMYEKDGKEWRAFKRRLRTMDKQGIKAPNGHSMFDYVGEKQQESIKLERQEVEQQKRERQQKKDRQKGRGFDR